MKQKFQKLVKAVVVALVLLTAILLVLSGRRSESNGHSSLRYYLSNHRRHPANKSDLVYISPWMTFDYINNIFDLPNNYLVERLGIYDSKYPFITLQKYSKNNHVDQGILIQNIRDTIEVRLATSSPQ